MGAKERLRYIGGAAVMLFAAIGAIAESQWWVVASLLLLGLFLAGRVLLPVIRERRAAEIARVEELAYRANRQNRWVRRGDSRGVYGPAGAEIMRTIEPKLPTMPSEEVRLDVEIASIAETPEDLATLIAKKSPGWRWAVFGSVLVQRRDAVQSRLRDCRLGFAVSNGVHGYSGAEIGRYVTDCMDELARLVGQTEAFMLTPAFMAVFGSPSDESTAEANGIVHVANRLMDYHDRFLALAERCRDFQAPSRYAGLMRDCSALMLIPLDGYRAFIDDFVEVVAEMPDVMIHGRGTIEMEPVQLHMSVDDQLLKRIRKQIQAAAKS